MTGVNRGCWRIDENRDVVKKRLIARENEIKKSHSEKKAKEET